MFTYKNIIDNIHNITKCETNFLRIYYLHYAFEQESCQLKKDVNFNMKNKNVTTYTFGTKN